MWGLHNPFDDDPIISLATTTLNLSGDEKNGGKFLNNTMFWNTLTRSDLAEGLRSAYLNGHGVKFLNYSPWAHEKGYANHVQWGATASASGDNVASAGITPFLGLAGNQSASYESAWIDYADFVMFAARYMADNHPDKIESSWKSWYDSATGLIHIEIAAIGFAESFTPADYNPAYRYLYAIYKVLTTTGGSAATWGAETIVSTHPDRSSWVDAGATSSNVSLTLRVINRDFSTFSDNRPSTTVETDVTTPQTGIYQQTAHTYYQDVSQVAPGISSVTTVTRSLEVQRAYPEVVQDSVLLNTTTEAIGGGVIKTTQHFRVTERILFRLTVQTGTEPRGTVTYSPRKVFIYREGSGNGTLDAMFQTSPASEDYLCFIPVRYRHINVDSQEPARFDQHIKALRKVTGKPGKQIWDSLVQGLAASPSNDKIISAYIMFGVPTNTEDNSGRRYMFEFFDEMYLQSPGNADKMNQFVAYMQAIAAWRKAQEDWRAAQTGDQEYWPWETYPKEPTLTPVTTLPEGGVSLNSGWGWYDFNYYLGWSGITKTFGTGTYSGLKVGKVKVEGGPQIQWDVWGFPDDDGQQIVYLRTEKLDCMQLTYQRTSNEWVQLRVYGIRHHHKINENYYNGAGYSLSNYKIPSNTLIPLNYRILRDRLSLVHVTQLSCCSMYLVCNAYQETDLPWWASDAFQIVVWVVAVVAAYWGDWTAMGWAEYLQAMVSMLVAYAISRIVVDLAIKLLGKKVGAIVGTIVAVYLSGQASSAMGGSSASAATLQGSMMSAQNLLLLTTTGMNAYSAYLQASTAEYNQQTANVVSEFEKRMSDITQAYLEEFGPADATSPAVIADAILHYNGEDLDTFLSRTLMTGSDIANMSLNMIGDFVPNTVISSPT